MNRVGQVWEFGGSDYIGVIVRSRNDGDVHDVVWLVQDNKLGDGGLYSCAETAFDTGSTIKRIA